MSSFAVPPGRECPICFEALVEGDTVSCGHHSHEVCLTCFSQDISAKTPMCFHIKCPLCRGNMKQGMFRMPSFGVLPGCDDWIRLMREGERHNECGLSEINFITLLALYDSFSRDDDESLYSRLPRCIQTYLDAAREDKRKDWYNALRTAAENLAYEKLCGDVPIERHGCQTSYPAEDIVIAIVRRDAVYEDGEERIYSYFSEEEVNSLSRIDPPNENDDDDEGDEDEGREEGGRNVRARREKTTEFQEVFDPMMDDGDADILWSIDPTSFAYRAEYQDYTFTTPGNRDDVMTYAHYMAITTFMGEINYHPDCCFIHCSDDGIRSRSVGNAAVEEPEEEEEG